MSLNFQLGILSGLIFCAQLFAQDVVFKSPVDDSLTIKTIAVLPILDNVGGIYSQPIEKKLNELVDEDHRWNLRRLNLAGPISRLEDLEQKPETLQKLISGTGIDALIGAEVFKGPEGISIQLDLFHTSNGKVLTQTSLKDYKRFDIINLEKQVSLLFQRLFNRLPYQGVILSRTGNRITINLGSKNGIENLSKLSIIQVTKLNRHPRFHFIVGAQKEILGQVKVLKVEPTLSFATVVYEREKGVLRKGNKVAGPTTINYDAPDDLMQSPEDLGAQRQKLEDKIAFGEGAQEWVPQKPPTFGQVGVKLGLGSYSANANLSSESLDASKFPYPLIGISGEIWLNPNWIARFSFEQGIASTENPRSGSSPESLSHSVSAYSFLVGYNFLLNNEFFGPKIEVAAGFSGYSDSVDDSNPTAFTSVKYSGLTLGLRGQMPLTPDLKWSAGLGLNFVLSPSLTETPVTSGTESSNGVTDFSLFGGYQLRTNLKIVGDLTFRLLRANFTGTGTRGETVSTASQKTTTLSGGVVYMF